MRTIERATAFRRDFKRESKGRYRTIIEAELKHVLTALALDKPLDPKYRDHDLIGNWKGYRECHIKPDLLLIYKRPNEKTLRLARLGSHSDLFG